ncbi:MAG: phage holin [Oscillospiraceae bacterium]|nr:phage holin [Oscillospiraceae bacterium]
MKVSAETIARTAALVVVVANQVLTIAGKNPLPWSENAVYSAAMNVATVVVAAWAWWKNNSFTKNAIKADKYLAELKKEE